jgi:hypothetical protein
MHPRAATSEQRPARLLWLVASGAAVFLAWIALVSWRLTEVPGMDMDEAWSILSARGEWPPIDPLSGMTRYAGPFPVLLLERLGTANGLGVLRGAGVVCNGLALLTLFAILVRLTPGRALGAWAFGLVATVPVWLVFTREGIELAMFGPLLALLGIYLLLHEVRWATFGAGVSWGLLSYNHPIGAFVFVGLGAGFWLVHRRLPALRWRALGAGFVLGFAPRLVALLAYDVPFEGTAAGYRPDRAIHDLIFLPAALWNTLNGRTLYLGYVGHEVLPVLPLWLLAVCFALPWRGRLRELPAAARVTAYGCLVMAALGTLATPSLAVRYLLYPCIGLTVFLVQLGATAIAEQPRWTPLIRSAAALMIAGNLVYMTVNFYQPWARGELTVSYHKLGNRNKRESNRGWLPKTKLVQTLRELGPAQVLSMPSLDRPLRVLLQEQGARVTTLEEGDPALRPTLYVTYFEADALPTHCVPVRSQTMCFARPINVDDQFLVYR